MIICNYLKLATADPETHVFKFFRIFTTFLLHLLIVPNIRYRPNIRQHILAEYSFSAETENFVFGRSLAVAHKLSLITPN
jgi:hypothetical protein